MSNIAQIQLRYSTVNTLDDLRAQIHAFPGNMSLVLENKTLYQFVIYGDGVVLPTDDGVSVLATTDADLRGRWVQIDSYSTKAVEGKIRAGILPNGSWQISNTVDDAYELRIPVVNPVNDFVLKLWEVSNGNYKKEVIPQEVLIDKRTKGVTEIIVIVGRVPDCTFEGSYFILKDKML